MRLNYGRQTKQILLEKGIFNDFSKRVKDIEEPEKIVELLKKYDSNLPEEYVIRLKKPRNFEYFDKCLFQKVII